MTHEVAERERRQQRKRQLVGLGACRRLDFDQRSPPDESHPLMHRDTPMAKVALKLTLYTIVCFSKA